VAFPCIVAERAVSAEPAGSNLEAGVSGMVGLNSWTIRFVCLVIRVPIHILAATRVLVIRMGWCSSATRRT